MLIMIVVGIPMYVCATASIPIAMTLMMKGFTPGVAFVFLASGPSTNIASLSILFNVIGKKTTILFVVIYSALSIVFGLLLDQIISIFNLDFMGSMNHSMMHQHNMENFDYTQLILAVIFLILLMFSLFRKYFTKKPKELNKMDSNETVLQIEGMTCNHCVMNVKKAISSSAGVTDVEVFLNEKKAMIKGDFNLIDIKKAIENVGYSVIN